MVGGIADGKADGIRLPPSHGNSVARPVDGITASPVGKGTIRNLIRNQTYTPRTGCGPQMSLDFFHGARRGGRGGWIIFFHFSFLPFLFFSFLFAFQRSFICYPRLVSYVGTNVGFRYRFRRWFPASLPSVGTRDFPFALNFSLGIFRVEGDN